MINYGMKDPGLELALQFHKRTEHLKYEGILLKKIFPMKENQLGVVSQEKYKSRLESGLPVNEEQFSINNNIYINWGFA